LNKPFATAKDRRVLNEDAILFNN